VERCFRDQHQVHWPYTRQPLTEPRSPSNRLKQPFNLNFLCNSLSILFLRLHPEDRNSLRAFPGIIYFLQRGRPSKSVNLSGSTFKLLFCMDLMPGESKQNNRILICWYLWIVIRSPILMNKE
jgi:hypothetical protein